MVKPTPKKSKPDAQQRKTFARGGGPNKMFGKGSRTTTSTSDAAGPQRAGSTAHKTTSRGGTLAEGGRSARAIGGVALPAAPGQTGTAYAYGGRRIKPGYATGGVVINPQSNLSSPMGEQTRREDPQTMADLQTFLRALNKGRPRDPATNLPEGGEPSPMPEED